MTPQGQGSAASQARAGVQVIKEDDRFRYIYETDPKTGQQRLIRRLSRQGSFEAFKGDGHKLG